MPPQHMLDEMFGNTGVPRCRLPVLQDDIIHHAEGRHQFRSRALRQQRPWRIGYLYNQRPSRGNALMEPADVFGEQGIEMTRHPLRRWLPVQTLECVFFR